MLRENRRLARWRVSTCLVRIVRSFLPARVHIAARRLPYAATARRMRFRARVSYLCHAAHTFSRHAVLPRTPRTLPHHGSLHLPPAHRRAAAARAHAACRARAAPHAPATCRRAAAACRTTHTWRACARAPLRFSRFRFPARRITVRAAATRLPRRICAPRARLPRTRARAHATPPPRTRMRGSLPRAAPRHAAALRCARYTRAAALVHGSGACRLKKGKFRCTPNAPPRTGHWPHPAYPRCGDGFA